ncbi:MAG: hypothetical protein J6P79_07215 [Pseudobutyrivibrio sp.]|nr:hypothetical protein [Pseudobutyrivibrio sp.]
MVKKRLSLFMVVCMTITSLVFSISPMTARAEDKIMDMVEGMTTQEKVAQMLMPSFRYWGEGDTKEGVTELNDAQKATLSKYSFGGVIVFAQNCQNAKQTTALIKAMQKANLDGGAESSLLVSIDQEGGYITRLNTGTAMPGNMAIGATGETENAYRAAYVIGKELAVQGINVDFAPVMDVNNNPANPIIGVRSFSDDPEVVAQFGAKYIEGLHNNGVMAALKHFPGHGDTNTDSHTGLPKIDKTYDELKQMELIPFAGVAKNADFIMTAHIQYPKIEAQTYTSISTGEEIYLPATLSKTILTDILRTDIGYEGVVITDAMDMAAIAEHFDEMDSARLAINAGADMILMPVDLSNPEGLAHLDEYIDGVVAQINSGAISADRVDESVYRIMKMKAKYGLLHDDSLNVMKKSSRITPSEVLAENTVGSKAHHEVEWGIAVDAITAVKNDDAFPVTSEKKVVVLYPAANQANSIVYGIERLKDAKVSVNSDNIVSLCTKDMAEENVLASTAGADVVIMISANYSADFTNQDLANKLVAKTHENGGKFILLSAQLPYDVTMCPEADGIIACYCAKGMAELPTGKPNSKQYNPNIPAAIYTLFGGSNPTGKLPVTIK